MPEFARIAFPYIAIAVWVIVPVYAAVQRGRTFAIFNAVTFGISLIGSITVHSSLPSWLPEPWLAVADLLFLWGITAAAVHYAHLVRAKLRGEVFRLSISAPGQAFVGASFLAAFWLLRGWIRFVTGWLRVPGIFHREGSNDSPFRRTGQLDLQRGFNFQQILRKCSRG